MTGQQRRVVAHLRRDKGALLALAIPGAIVAEAGLSFLGLGLLPPAPSWGIMLSDGFSVLRSAPHIALSPGLAIAATMLALLVLGDSLRDAVDPTMSNSV